MRGGDIMYDDLKLIWPMHRRGKKIPSKEGFCAWRHAILLSKATMSMQTIMEKISIAKTASSSHENHFSFFLQLAWQAATSN